MSADLHLTEIVQGTVIDSDYPGELNVGREVYVSRCSCGWSKVRQILSSARSQADRHLRSVELEAQQAVSS